MKTCTKCQELKPLALYSKNKNSSDGLQQQCKFCNSAYYKLNAEKVLARLAATYAADPTKIKERAAKWYAENSDRARANSKKWGADNRELKARYNADWNRRNPEKSKEMKRQSWLKNPEAKNANTRSYRAWKKGAEGSHTAADVRKLLLVQRCKCAVCSEDLEGKYHVDHMMPLALGGTNDKTNLQLLCRSCNTSKGAQHPSDFMQKRGFLI